MNTYQLVIRDDYQSKQIGETFQRALQSRQWEKKEVPELVIAVGGDGTMLQAFHQYYTPDTHFLGVHTGTLGFYADWDKEEVNKLIEKILTTAPDVVRYPLVEVTIEQLTGEKQEVLALNEVVVKSKTLSTFLMEVFINEEHFETFRGDGMIVSTPSGSTAYNHAVDGSLLHPSLEAMQISELAAINNKEFRTLGRSFVMPKHHTLDFYIKNPDKDVLIGIDGFDYSTANITKIQCKVSETKVKFVRYRDFPFWKRVKEKFLKE